MVAGGASNPSSVGSRELKTRLGTYLRKVKEGATLIVTERGRPIAELRPITVGDGLEERLYRLAAQGLVTREIREPAGLGDFQPVALAPASPAVSAALLEDREDRF
jgi:prevent-host-death family protein